MVGGHTEMIDTVAFGLIGIAVIAVGFGSFGAMDTAALDLPPQPSVALAAVASIDPVVVYDVQLSGLPSSPLPAAVGGEGEEIPAAEPQPEVAAAAAAQGEASEAPAAPAPRSGDPAARGARRNAGEAAPQPTGRGKRRCDELPDPRIVQTGTDRYAIEESVIQRYTSDWSRLGELGWSEVHDGPDGKADGFRIGGIRCGSDPYDAGFRSGDVIHAVNGRKVRSIPQAIMVYAAIHGESVFEVDLTRNGQRKTVRYRLGR